MRVLEEGGKGRKDEEKVKKEVMRIKRRRRRRRGENQSSKLHTLGAKELTTYPCQAGAQVDAIPVQVELKTLEKPMAI